MKILSSMSCVALVLALAALPRAAPASTTGTASGSSGPSTSAYIENPQPSVVVSNSYSGSYYGPSSNYSASSYWGGGYYDGHVSVYRPRRYFFPPNPPALGEPYLRNRTKSASLGRSTIPITLSEYVNEPFYSPLSPFLYEESISRRRQKSLDDYLAAKQVLVEELRAKIATLRAADPATRESQLAQFAREQTPRVRAVETTAYAIRDDLTRWHLFSDSADWNEGRDWRLGDDTRWESTLDEAKAMRGAAFYQDGLTPAQRRLLREFAMELEDSGAGPTTELQLHARGPYFYFSPETSRIRLPADLPTELAAKIREYVQTKTALKQELRDTIYREDRRWFDSHRVAALRELAVRQEPRFAAVEALAEEIRRGLAPLPNPSRPASAAQVLPADLADRITAFMDQKAAYERAMNTRQTALKKQFPTSRVEFVKLDAGFGIQLVANRSLRPEDGARADNAKAQLASFNSEQMQIYNDLVTEKQAIRQALVKSAGALAPMVTSRIVDLILRDYSSTLAIQELWRQYRDYEIAVLQPGLSPEQRRMLYDAALVQLDQQLPHYTY